MSVASADLTWWSFARLHMRLALTRFDSSENCIGRCREDRACRNRLGLRIVREVGALGRNTCGDSCRRAKMRMAARKQEVYDLSSERQKAARRKRRWPDKE